MTLAINPVEKLATSMPAKPKKKPSLSDKTKGPIPVKMEEMPKVPPSGPIERMKDKGVKIKDLIDINKSITELMEHARTRL